MLQRVTNAHHLCRAWPHLVNAETGATLELAPGESADVDLPAEFADAHLTTSREAVRRVAKPKPSRAPKGRAAEPITPPAEPAVEDPQPPVDPAVTKE